MPPIATCIFVSEIGPLVAGAMSNGDCNCENVVHPVTAPVFTYPYVEVLMNGNITTPLIFVTPDWTKKEDVAPDVILLNVLNNTSV